MRQYQRYHHCKLPSSQVICDVDDDKIISLQRAYLDHLYPSAGAELLGAVPFRPGFFRAIHDDQVYLVSLQIFVKGWQQSVFKKDELRRGIANPACLLADGIAHIDPDSSHRTFQHPGVKQGHVVVVQDGGVKIPLPETEAMLQDVAQSVGEFVHPGVGKPTAPFDVDHRGIAGKPQGSLLKYAAHVYDYRIRLLIYQIILEVISLLCTSII